MPPGSQIGPHKRACVYQLNSTCLVSRVTGHMVFTLFHFSGLGVPRLKLYVFGQVTVRMRRLGSFGASPPPFLTANITVTVAIYSERSPKEVHLAIGVRECPISLDNSRTVAGQRESTHGEFHAIGAKH
jgi:hypothetical protein